MTAWPSALAQCSKSTRKTTLLRSLSTFGTQLPDLCEYPPFFFFFCSYKAKKKTHSDNFLFNRLHVLKEHLNTIVVLHVHPRLPNVLLTTGHDAEVILWDIPKVGPFLLPKSFSFVSDVLLFFSCWRSCRTRKRSPGATLCGTRSMMPTMSVVWMRDFPPTAFLLPSAICGTGHA